MESAKHKHENQLSSAERADLLSRIETLVGFVSANSLLRVSLGSAGEGNLVIPRKRQIVLDPDFIEANPNRAQLVALKYAAESVVLVDNLKVAGLDKNKIEEVFSQPGFTFVHSILESLTAENWAISRYSGAATMFDELYAKPDIRESLMSGKILNYLVEKEDGSNLNSSKFIQFALEVEERARQNWQAADQSHDASTAELVDLLTEDLKLITKTIPRSRWRFDRLRAARSRFDIFNQNIYPALELLIEYDLVNKALQEAGLPDLESTFADGDAETQEGCGTAGAIDQILNEDDESVFKQNGPLEEPANPAESNSGSPDSDLQPLASYDAPTIRDQQEEALEDLLAEMKEKIIAGLVSLSQLPLEEQEEALTAANTQTVQMQEDLKQLLESDFQFKEVVEEDLFLGAKVTPPSINIEDFIESMKGQVHSYDTYYERVSDLVYDLYRRLEPFFRLNRNPRWQSGFESGRKLNLRALMQAEGGPVPRLDVWQKRDIPHRRNYVFSLLLDSSGSMEGINFKESCKGMTVFLETLELLKVETQLILFGDDARIVKDFDDTLDDSCRQHISDQLIPRSRTTAMLRATELAEQSLASKTQAYKYIVNITDGLPANIEGFQKKLQAITEANLIQMIGLGIGPDTQNVLKYYPLSRYLEHVGYDPKSDLYFPKIITDLIEELILWHHLR